MQRGFGFTQIGSFRIEDNSFNFPGDVYKLYITNYMDMETKGILINWLKNIQLTDEDYKMLIQNSFSTSQAGLSLSSNDFFAAIGVELLDINKFEFKIIEDRLEIIKTETIDECLLNILQPLYKDILKEEFPNNNVSLGLWKSESKTDLQSLNGALRSAYKFTLFEYLYGDTACLYENFESFFLIEFWKRAHLVKNIWDTRNGNDPIEYIPIYENLRNYNLSKKTSVVKALKTILDSGFISLDDKDEVKNKLYDQISDSLQSRDREALNIQNDIIQPIISKQINWEKALETLESAKILFNSKSYASSVNRSYYSMLYCVRSMMSEKGILNHWKNRTISPDEDHMSVETGLNTLISQGIMERNFLTIFRNVKKDRWVADYSDILVDKTIAFDCINKAEQFLQKTESIINYK